LSYPSRYLNTFLGIACRFSQILNIPARVFYKKNRSLPVANSYF